LPAALEDDVEDLEALFFGMCERRDDELMNNSSAGV
jgi:hypothetical protein